MASLTGLWSMVQLIPFPTPRSYSDLELSEALFQGLDFSAFPTGVRIFSNQLLPVVAN
ncbi:MAG: hypothetical protein WBQ76_04990 [Candidatus Korobacteraceae bacterium]